LAIPYELANLSVNTNRAWFLTSIGKNWLNRIIQIRSLRRIHLDDPIIELFDWYSTPILPFKDRWLLLSRVEVVDMMEREGYNLLLENWL
jgi:hypothetical protein